MPAPTPTPTPAPSPRVTLDAILAATRRRVAALAPRAAELERQAAAAPPPPGGGFPAVGSSDQVGIVAEVKRRSPSQGAIRPELDVVAHARGYVRGGAVAVSVLTDDVHFGGSLEDLRLVAGAVPVPVIRKDFILHELQLLEARIAGAGVVLLIARALPPPSLGTLARAARGLGLDPLVEVHSAAELDAVLAADVAAAAIGVNARDLATFEVDPRAAERVLARVPPGIPAVAESGVESRADVERGAAAGADFVLVGTSVARAADPAAAVRALAGVRRVGRS